MARLVTRARRARADTGFTLIEVVIAMTVLLGALASVGYLGTLAMTDVAVARERQTATGLADQAIEQVRALSYDTIAKGLDDTDMAGDSAITTSGGNYFYKSETIPHGNNASIGVAPLYPHKATTTVRNMTYTVATYVTYYNNSTTSRAFRITSDVSWTSGLRGSGVVRSVQAQTVIYSSSGTGSGSGCGSTATHPFAAPCQPFLYAASDAAPGSITFTAGSTGTALTGSTFERGVLSIPYRSTNMSIEQIWSVISKVTTSGCSYRNAGDVADTVPGPGVQTATASADNDVSSTSRPEYSSASTPSQSSGTVTFNGSGGNNSLAFSCAAGDTASAVATTNASSTNTCNNAASPAIAQTNSLPCGNGVTSMGGTLSATAVMAGASTTLASLSATSTGASHTMRVTSPGSASSCLSTQSGSDGCVSASHRRTIGFFSVGCLPSLVTAPVGFSGTTCLVSGTNLVSTVSAEAGIGSAAPTATRTGTLSYWNGLGYSSLTLSGSTSAAISIPAISVTNVLNSTTVTVSANLRTGATSAPACAAPCYSATSSVESPVVGDVFYKIVTPTATLDLAMHIDFGTITASATYKVAS